jgi:hydrogenase expression/formation protein HypC
MCLGIPGRVVERVEGYGGQLALVDVLGSQRRVNIGMLEDAEQAALTAGEWVIIHMGFIVERVDEAAAEKAMVGLELMGQSREAAAPVDDEQLPRVG